MTDTTTPPVVFDAAYFKAAYPEFAGLSDPQAESYFDRASLVCWNSVFNPAFCITQPNVLKMLMYLATAHIAWLNAPRDASGNPASSGSPPSPIVGRINTATEGSVSVGAEWNGSGSPSEAWWIQTRYGAEWWQATAQFRTARYLANPTIVPGTQPAGFAGTFFGVRGRSGRC